MLTSRFTAVYRFLGAGLQPAFVPVRTSLGTPRFIAGAEAWPYASKLAPYGLRNIEDRDEFTAAYRARLDTIGLDVIHAQLLEIHQSYDRPLALLCYEDVDTSWCHRSLFADWWKEAVGQEIDEANTLEALKFGWSANVGTRGGPAPRC